MVEISQEKDIRFQVGITLVIYTAKGKNETRIMHKLDSQKNEVYTIKQAKIIGKKGESQNLDFVSIKYFQLFCCVVL